MGLSEVVGEAKYGGDGVGSIDPAMMIGYDGIKCSWMGGVGMGWTSYYGFGGAAGRFTSLGDIVMSRL